MEEDAREEVRNCSRRAWVDYESDLGNFQPISPGSPEASPSRDPKRPFIKGKDRLFPQDVGWLFVNAGGTGGFLFDFLTKLTMESGVQAWLEGLGKYPLKRGTLDYFLQVHSKKQPEAVSTRSKLVIGLSWIYVTALGLCGVCFATEVLTRSLFLVPARVMKVIRAWKRT